MSNIGFLKDGSESALDIQVGGSHYQHMKPQPIELFATLNWDYFRAGITKYVVRYRYKNGIEDLKKAKHLFSLANELGVPRGCQQNDVDIVNLFCVKNRIPEDIARIIKTAMYGDWVIGKELVSILIGAEYPNEE